MTILKMHKTSVLKKLVQIQRKVLWYSFEENGKSAKLDNKVFADKDEINKNKTENYMIVDLVTLVLHNRILLLGCQHQLFYCCLL